MIKKGIQYSYYFINIELRSFIFMREIFYENGRILLDVYVILGGVLWKSIVLFGTCTKKRE